MKVHIEQALSHLVERLVAKQDERLHGILPDSVLAGLLENRLLPEVREKALRKLAAADELRRIACEVGPLEVGATDVSAATTISGVTAGAQRIAIWRMASVAALVLAAVGSFLWMRSGAAEKPLTGDALLVATTDSLRAAMPDVFGDFAPRDHAMRVAMQAAPLRGGVLLSLPRGRVLPGRPEFIWQPVVGAATYRVTVFDDLGRDLWTETTSDNRIAYGEQARSLRDGTAYGWKVTADGPTGEVTGTGSLQVVSDTEHRRYAEGSKRIRAMAVVESRDTLLVQWAMHNKLYADAARIVIRSLRSDAAQQPSLIETWEALRRIMHLEGTGGP